MTKPSLTKICLCCNEEKTFDAFHKDKQKSDGLTSHCKDCRKKEAAERWPKYKDKASVVSKEWKKQNKNKVAAHARKNRLKNLDVRKEYDKKRAIELPEYFAYKTAKRRGAKLQRTPAWLSSDDLWIIEEAYSLAKLRTEMTGFKWHVDHVLPLQGKTVSGLHVPENLQVIPAILNLQKSSKYDPA